MADEFKPERSGTSQTPPQMSRHGKRIVWSLLSLAVVAVLVAAYWYAFIRGWVSTDDAFVDSDQLTISSKILGRAVELTAAEGDTVRAGQALVALDSADLKAQEAQAQASYQYVLQSLPVAKLTLERAREDFRRAEVQFKGEVVTREQYDHARIAMQLAEAQYTAAVSQAGSAQAQLAVVQTQLQNTRIASPSKAVVAKKWVMAGDIVQPGQPIYTLFDLSEVWITANFEETKLSAIRIGEPVEISLDAFPALKLAGRVELIGAAAAARFSLIPPNNASGNFTKVTQRVPIKISIDLSPSADPSGKLHLLPGMSATVRLKDRNDR